jgi:4-hydroxybenzoate polyprenyltransferase
VKVFRTFGGAKRSAIFRILRVPQWVKNLLIFVPLCLHHAFDLRTVLSAAVSAVAFCLTASAIYIFNDLLDLQQDRRHPRKKFRPLASGAVSIPAQASPPRLSP